MKNKTMTNKMLTVLTATTVAVASAPAFAEEVGTTPSVDTGTVIGNVDVTPPVNPEAPSIVEPTVPETPTNPTTPDQSSDTNVDSGTVIGGEETPVVPTNPETPAITPEEPSKPSEETKPSEEAKSSESKESEKEEQTKPSKPVEENQTTDSEKLVVPVEPSHSSEPVQPEVPVMPEEGVMTESGEKIIATVDSQVVVEDSFGNQVVKSAESVGAVVKADKTVEVKTADGQMLRLPETGTESGFAKVIAGVVLVGLGVLYFFRDKIKAILKKSEKEN
ncbi:LPXTG cell wall anchor domain-containing protein [Streptococcus danieliae]|uniref:LPXTG cell wall anchor domain-containing protein n=1 Tax=Streptococcus danieliae TaxID=747656 RepID=UPI0026EFBB39|nr:LPXTG cell wall anchor domain-containing protein [Streptococcus danieliae]